MGRVSRELVAASAPKIILSILSFSDNYGYEILQKVKELSGGRMKWNEGSIYPVLKKMEAHGMVKSYLILGENERPRKYYSLLEPGKLELQAEIEEWYIVHAMLTKLWDSDT